MIPEKLKMLVEQQLGNIHRKNKLAVERALVELGILFDSEFAEFFFEYVITLFQSDVSDEQLCDLIEPTDEIAIGTKFVHEVWELPERYICLTSIQSEGAYLYDKETGKVRDFDLSLREDFLAGKSQIEWAGFFDFMIWYLSED